MGLKIYTYPPSDTNIAYMPFSISDTHSSSFATPCIPINSVSKTISQQCQHPSVFPFPLSLPFTSIAKANPPHPPLPCPRRKRERKKLTKRTPSRNRPHGPLPVPKLRRNRQDPLIPNTHVQQPFVPALDDLPVADGEVEGRAAVVGGVELGAVGGEGAAVVDGDGVAPLGLAGAGVADCVLGCYFGREGEEGEGEEGEEGEAHGCLLVCTAGVDLRRGERAIEVGGGDLAVILGW